VFLHECYFSIVHLADVLLLLFVTLEAPDAIRKSKTAVVVDSIDRVRKHLVKTGEVHAKPGKGLRQLMRCDGMETHVFPSMKRM
jgi:hypothetical protein